MRGCTEVFPDAHWRWNVDRNVLLGVLVLTLGLLVLLVPAFLQVVVGILLVVVGLLIVTRRVHPF